MFPYPSLLSWLFLSPLERRQFESPAEQQRDDAEYRMTEDDPDRPVPTTRQRIIGHAFNVGVVLVAALIAILLFPSIKFLAIILALVFVFVFAHEGAALPKVLAARAKRADTSPGRADGGPTPFKPVS